MFSRKYTKFIVVIPAARLSALQEMRRTTCSGMAQPGPVRMNALTTAMLLLTVILAAPTWALVITEDTILTEDLGSETITFAADNVVLNGNGHTIDNGSVEVRGRTGVTVKNLKLVRSWGVLVFESSDVVIENVEVSDSFVGIVVFWSQAITVVNNTVTNGLWGIVAVSGLEHSLIASNTCIGNGVGIGVQSSNDNSIEDNLLDSNFIGLKLGFIQTFEDQPFFGSDRITVARNVVTNNDVGAIVADSFDNDLFENSISGSADQGILLLRSDRNNVDDNDVDANGVGIELREADSNFIRFNVLEGNGECIVETDSVGNHFIQNVCLP